MLPTSGLSEWRNHHRKHKTTDRGEQNKEEGKERYGIGRRPLPNGFAAVAALLFGVTFLLVLLLWRLGGGTW